MPTAKFFFPYPPSVNTYWGFQGHRRFLTNKALAFKAVVAQEVAKTNTRFGDARLAVIVKLYPPDKRARDLDNTLKPTIDAMMQAGLFNDDSQVDVIVISRGDRIKGGLCEVVVSTEENFFPPCNTCI